MIINNIPPIVSDRLYRLTERLERLDTKRQLPADLDSECILDVLHWMQADGIDPFRQTSHYLRLAEGRLCYRWNQKARKIYAIRLLAEKNGRPQEVSINGLGYRQDSVFGNGDGGACGEEYCSDSALQTDLYGRHRQLHECSVEICDLLTSVGNQPGLSEEDGWVFYWREVCDLDWDDIVDRLEEQFDVKTNAVCARQRFCRRRGKILALMRELIEEAPGAPDLRTSPSIFRKNKKTCRRCHRNSRFVHFYPEAKRTNEREKVMKTIRIPLPSQLEILRGRHASPMARVAMRTGNASGQHGTSRYGKRERQQNRKQERNACMHTEGRE